MGTNYFVPTGVIIKEYLDERNISQKELAIRLNASEKHISNVLNGKVRLTEDMALKLEKIITDVSASYWLNLEAKYREFLARIDFENKLNEDELKAVSIKFHFNEVFKGLKWSIKKQAQEMLKILKISNFNCFDEVYANLNVNFFEDGGKKEAIAIWLGLCEQEIYAQNDDLTNIDYSKDKLEDNLLKFKDIATNKDLEESINICKKMCNKLGIYLVKKEAIINSKVRGAIITYNNHPAIFLSMRFKTHDNTWFAFIHEIAHLLMHYNENEVMVSFEDELTTEKKEKEANEFARNFFINPIEYLDFIKTNEFSLVNINQFAAKQNVHSGIVVARLQHDGYIGMNKFNHKK